MRLEVLPPLSFTGSCVVILGASFGFAVSVSLFTEAERSVFSVPFPVPFNFAVSVSAWLLSRTGFFLLASSDRLVRVSNLTWRLAFLSSPFWAEAFWRDCKWFKKFLASASDNPACFRRLIASPWFCWILAIRSNGLVPTPESFGFKFKAWASDWSKASISASPFKPSRSSKASNWAWLISSSCNWVARILVSSINKSLVTVFSIGESLVTVSGTDWGSFPFVADTSWLFELSSVCVLALGWVFSARVSFWFCGEFSLDGFWAVSTLCTAVSIKSLKPLSFAWSWVGAVGSTGALTANTANALADI